MSCSYHFTAERLPVTENLSIKCDRLHRGGSRSNFTNMFLWARVIIREPDDL